MDIGAYFKNRFTERSTAAGLAALLLGAAQLVFPEYAAIIATIGMVAGVGVAAVPTSKN